MTPTLKQVAQQALEALEARCGTNADERKELIPALRAALAAEGEAQPAIAFTTGIEWHEKEHFESEKMLKVTRKAQSEYGFTITLYTAPQPAGIAGWKLVPVEPTPEMVEAIDNVMWPGASEKAYRAMLAAAPQPAERAARGGAA